MAQLSDANGRKGAATWQKILCSLRRLGEGCSFYSLDDMSRMSTESMWESFTPFCSAIHKCYGEEYLNKFPTPEEIHAIETKYAARSFPRHIVALDCMHISWKNCPKACKGQYYNPRSGKMDSIQVEAVYDTDLYYWNLFCGRPGTNNNITVMKSSPLLLSILNGDRSIKIDRGYCVDGHNRNWFLYFSTDGIYHSWAILVKPIHAPLTINQSQMAKAQESRRKDLERLFGVLRGRFKILRYEFYEWSDERIVLIVETCVSVHNMIIRFHQDGLLNEERNVTGKNIDSVGVVQEFPTRSIVTADISLPKSARQSQTQWVEELLRVENDVRSVTANSNLRRALENNIWNEACNNIY